MYILGSECEDRCTSLPLKKTYQICICYKQADVAAVCLPAHAGWVSLLLSWDPLPVPTAPPVLLPYLQPLWAVINGAHQSGTAAMNAAGSLRLTLGNLVPLLPLAIHSPLEPPAEIIG